MLAILCSLLVGGLTLMGTGRVRLGLVLVLASIVLFLLIRHMALVDGPPAELPDV